MTEMNWTEQDRVLTGTYTPGLAMQQAMVEAGVINPKNPALQEHEDAMAAMDIVEGLGGLL